MEEINIPVYNYHLPGMISPYYLESLPLSHYFIITQAHVIRLLVWLLEINQLKNSEN